MTFTQLITYFVFNSVFDKYVHVDFRVSDEVRYGNSVVLFLRPIKYFFYHLSIEIGHRSVAVLLHMLPTLAFAIIFLGFRFYGAVYTSLGILSALLGISIAFIWSFLFGLTSYWTHSYKGTYKIKDGIEWIFAGSFIPIIFFPEFLRKFLMMTPLPYMDFIPPMIFLGKYTVIESLGYMAVQVFWIAALYTLWRLLFSKAYKKFSGVGV